MSVLEQSVLDLYSSLNPSGFPNGVLSPIALDLVPEVVAGNQLTPPYTVYSLVQNREQLTFESDETEDTRLTMKCYATSALVASQMMLAIRYNGQPLSAQAGFDCGVLTTLTDGTFISMLPEGPPVKEFAGKTVGGVRIHKVTMSWVITVQRT